MITWRPVESSNVAQIGWPGPGEVLKAQLQPEGFMSVMLVRFTNGQAYAYIGVSRQRAVYLATRCNSVGKYVNEVVKTKYPSLRVPELDSSRALF